MKIRICAESRLNTEIFHGENVLLEVIHKEYDDFEVHLGSLQKNCIHNQVCEFGSVYSEDCEEEFYKNHRQLKVDRSQMSHDQRNFGIQK